jgi:hypothetical protein
MGFNLRGGRPKSMNQGIYWVQRHRDDQRRIANSERAAHKNAEKISSFNEKWRRINNNYQSYMKTKASQTILTTPAKLRFLQNKVEAAAELKEMINDNIESVSMKDLSKLSTIYRDIMKKMAEACGDQVCYKSELKLLTINGKPFDFS